MPVWSYSGGATPSQLSSRICTQRRRRVPGRVDLGDDLDEASCRVSDDAGVVLGRVGAAGTAFHVGRSADLGEQRARRHVEAPALVVGEMEVQPVHLVQRDQVDVTQHRLHGAEVAGDVEHRAAVRETWTVRDVGTMHRPRAGLHGGRLGSRGQHQPQGREPAEHSLCGRRRHLHALGIGAQCVVLGAEPGVGPERDHDVGGGWRLGGDGERVAGRSAQPRREAVDDDAHSRVITCLDDAARSRQLEPLARPGNVGRGRRHDGVGDPIVGRGGIVNGDVHPAHRASHVNDERASPRYPSPSSSGF